MGDHLPNNKIIITIIKISEVTLYSNIHLTSEMIIMLLSILYLVWKSSPQIERGDVRKKERHRRVMYSLYPPHSPIVDHKTRHHGPQFHPARNARRSDLGDVPVKYSIDYEESENGTLFLRRRERESTIRLGDGNASRAKKILVGTVEL